MSERACTAFLFKLLRFIGFLKHLTDNWWSVGDYGLRSKADLLNVSLMLEKGMRVKIDAMQKEDMCDISVDEWAVDLYFCGFFLTVVSFNAFFLQELSNVKSNKVLFRVLNVINT